ncbi:uncharacterized protein LOC133722953 [Rosa rugosa]|uniref:uncharacterized protein LOC133722953 n=1 Tax=Rosa rugosa TaxID=74645 RepID=UPI002B403927|nr:uncharacterized protein LOC133722953 [Rosa rugosa]
MHTRLSLNNWQRSVFGCRGREIDQLRARLQVLSESPLSVENQGDRNTKFFHRKASNRWAKNRLIGLFDHEGVWQDSVEGMEGVVLHYFSKMFSAGIVDYNHMHASVDLIQPRVTASMNADLCAPYSAVEIRAALFQMYPTKAPGPDGMPPLFFQKYWDVVGSDVVSAVQSFLTSGQLLGEINFTHICLIPKVKNPESVADLRPIALCNVIYKICSKVIANRLKKILDVIISPFQSAFIRGRLITDNTLIANEVSHYIHNCYSSTEGVFSLKLDMSKAYDWMEWKFLEAVLLRLGFDESWVGLIMQCVTTVRYAFLINGQPRGYLVPSRGLPQGDPLSPYLFLLCTEVFSALLERKASVGALSGIKVCKGAPAIHHLLFADDSLLFGKASSAECYHIKEVLLDYELASGQQINFTKSSIVFSKKVSEDDKVALAALLGVMIEGKHDKYLGLPTYLGRHKTESFAYIKEKLSKKLAGWQDFGGVVRMLTGKSIGCLGRSSVCPKMKVEWAPSSRSPSACWRGIFGAMEVIKKGIRWQIGDGSSVRIWEDPWIPRPHLFRPLRFHDVPYSQVSELMQNGEWDKELVQTIFSPDDALIILSLPLSSNRVADRVIWHYDPKGRFTTKSAYHLAFSSLHSALVEASGSSEPSNFWKCVWAAKVPGKVKVHAWKVCQPILPTLSQLLGRRVPLVGGCYFCNEEDECIAHIMVDCPFIRDLITMVPSLQGVLSVMPFDSLLLWLQACNSSLTRENFSLLLILLWSVWKERNKRVWSNKFHSLSQVYFQAMSLFQSVKMVLSVKAQRGGRRSRPWSPPPAGWLKVNMDGAFDVVAHRGGIGVVVCDVDGRIVARACARVSVALSPALVEAFAGHLACRLVEQFSLAPVVFETDCLQLVNAIQADGEDISEFGRVVDDISHALSILQNCQFSHVGREANVLAHKLAKCALGTGLILSWCGSVPTILEELLCT